MNKQKLPEGWREVTLAEVSLEKGQYGSGASAIEFDLKKPRYVRITDIDNDGVLKEEDSRSPSEVEERYFLESLEIILAASSSKQIVSIFTPPKIVSNFPECAIKTVL